MSDSEGVIYVSQNGAFSTSKAITAEDIIDALSDLYIEEQLDKTSSKIFNGMYSLVVRDPDGEELEDVSARLRSIAEAPGNDLWARMRQAWRDQKGWGPCIIYPRWRRDGNEVVLQELRRLPPESFSRVPSTRYDRVYSDLLPGITISDDGELEFWQTQDAATLEPVKLKKGVVLLKDAASTSLTGSSLIGFLVSFVKMMGFSWDSQMKKVFRVGSPIFLIRITGPGQADDVAYAQKVLQNWGQNTAFQLRSNMEAVKLDITDSEVALATIDKLEKRLASPFRNTTLDKEGSTLGGNADAQKEGDDDWIQGERTKIEDQFEGLLQRYLDLNGYEGCSVEIRIAVKKSVAAYVEARQAEVGFSTGCMTINERRAKLGLDPLDEDGIEELIEETVRLKEAMGAGAAPAAVTDPAFGNLPLDQVKERAGILAAVTGIDPVDPERFMSTEEQLAFLGKRK